MKFLCVPLRYPDEAPDRWSAGPRFALDRLRVSRMRLRDGDAHQRPGNADGAVARRPHRPARRRNTPRRRRCRQSVCPPAARPRQRCPVLGAGANTGTVAGRVPGRPAPSRGSRPFPGFVRPMARAGSRWSPRSEAASEVIDERSSTRRPYLLRYVTAMVTRHGPRAPRSRRNDVRPPRTSSPGTSPTAATSPASTVTSTPAARRWSTPENFADRSELGTEECFGVIDQIAAFAPECVTILTGGEPLLRRDILEIVRRAAERGLWVVVGTNGVRITENVARRLAEAGARGCRCRSMRSIPTVTTTSGECAARGETPSKARRSCTASGFRSSCRRRSARTTCDELEAIADFAHDGLGAKVWNLYFLVPTGRGQFVSDITPGAVRRGPRVALSVSSGVRRGCWSTRSARRTHRANLPSAARPPGRRSPLTYSPAGRQQLPGGHPLHGHPAERRRHPLSVSPGLRGEPSWRGLRGSLVVLGAVHGDPSADVRSAAAAARAS